MQGMRQKNHKNQFMGNNNTTNGNAAYKQPQPATNTNNYQGGYNQPRPNGGGAPMGGGYQQPTNQTPQAQKPATVTSITEAKGKKGTRGNKKSRQK